MQRAVDNSHVTLLPFISDVMPLLSPWVGTDGKPLPAYEINFPADCWAAYANGMMHIGTPHDNPKRGYYLLCALQMWGNSIANAALGTKTKMPGSKRPTRSLYYQEVPKVDVVAEVHRDTERGNVVRSVRFIFIVNDLAWAAAFSADFGQQIADNAEWWRKGADGMGNNVPLEKAFRTIATYEAWSLVADAVRGDDVCSSAQNDGIDPFYRAPMADTDPETIVNNPAHPMTLFAVPTSRRRFLTAELYPIQPKFFVNNFWLTLGRPGFWTSEDREYHDAVSAIEDVDEETQLQTKQRYKKIKNAQLAKAYRGATDPSQQHQSNEDASTDDCKDRRFPLRAIARTNADVHREFRRREQAGDQTVVADRVSFLNAQLDRLDALFTTDQSQLTASQRRLAAYINDKLPDELGRYLRPVTPVYAGMDMLSHMLVYMYQQFDWTQMCVAHHDIMLLVFLTTLNSLDIHEGLHLHVLLESVGGTGKSYNIEAVRAVSIPGMARAVDTMTSIASQQNMSDTNVEWRYCNEANLEALYGSRSKNIPAPGAYKSALSESEWVRGRMEQNQTARKTADGQQMANWFMQYYCKMDSFSTVMASNQDARDMQPEALQRLIVVYVMNVTRQRSDLDRITMLDITRDDARIDQDLSCEFKAVMRLIQAVALYVNTGRYIGALRIEDGPGRAAWGRIATEMGKITGRPFAGNRRMNDQVMQTALALRIIAATGECLLRPSVFERHPDGTPRDWKRFSFRWLRDEILPYLIVDETAVYTAALLLRNHIHHSTEERMMDALLHMGFPDRTLATGPLETLECTCEAQWRVEQEQRIDELDALARADPTNADGIAALTAARNAYWPRDHTPLCAAITARLLPRQGAAAAMSNAKDYSYFMIDSKNETELAEALRVTYNKYSAHNGGELSFIHAAGFVRNQMSEIMPSAVFTDKGKPVRGSTSLKACLQVMRGPMGRDVFALNTSYYLNMDDGTDRVVGMSRADAYVSEKHPVVRAVMAARDQFTPESIMVAPGSGGYQSSDVYLPSVLRTLQMGPNKKAAVMARNTMPMGPHASRVLYNGDRAGKAAKQHDMTLMLEGSQVAHGYALQRFWGRHNDDAFFQLTQPRTVARMEEAYLMQKGKSLLSNYPWGIVEYYTRTAARERYIEQLTQRIDIDAFGNEQERRVALEAAATAMMTNQYTSDLVSIVADANPEVALRELRAYAMQIMQESDDNARTAAAEALVAAPPHMRPSFAPLSGGVAAAAATPPPQQPQQPQLLEMLSSADIAPLSTLMERRAVNDAVEARVQALVDANPSLLVPVEQVMNQSRGTPLPATPVTQQQSSSSSSSSANSMPAWEAELSNGIISSRRVMENLSASAKEHRIDLLARPRTKRPATPQAATPKTDESDEIKAKRAYFDGVGSRQPPAKKQRVALQEMAESSRGAMVPTSPQAQRSTQVTPPPFTY